MNSGHAYIPALRFKVLTPLYDFVLRWLMREERFKRRLIQSAGILPGQQVLDLGCGTATLTLMLKKTHPGALVSGLDADPAVLALGRAKAEKVGIQITLDQGLAFDLPYPAASFDRVLSSLVFHHLTTQDKQLAMLEAYRVLRASGRFYILDFGPPHSLWSRMISPMLARLEEVSDNHKGMIPVMMRLAKFQDVSTFFRMESVFGTLHLYGGRKQA